MIYFTTIVSILFYFSIWKTTRSPHIQTGFLLLLFFQMLIIIGCRDISIGIDTKTYVEYFFQISKYRFSDLLLHYNELPFYKSEIGYILLNKVYSLFPGEHRALLVGNAVISLMLLFRYVTKESKEPLYSIFLFFTLGFFVSYLSFIRQYIAMLIVYCFWDYFKERKTKRFLCIVAAAALFHASILIFIPIYFLCGTPFTWRKGAVIGLAGCALWAMYDQLMIVFSSVGTFKYISYMMNETMVSNGRTAVFFLIIYLFCLFYGSWGGIKVYNEFYWLGLCACLSYIGGWQMYWFTRIGDMLGLSFIVLIPDMICNIRNRRERQIAGILITLAGISYFILWFTFVGFHSENFYPYRFGADVFTAIR